MPGNIDIELLIGEEPDIDIEIGYSGPSIDITITRPVVPVIEIELGVGPMGPQGPAGGTEVIISDLVLGEIPAGLVNGVNNSFTTAFEFASVSLYINGLKQMNAHFSTSGNSVIIIDDPPQTGDEVTVDYLKL